MSAIWWAQTGASSASSSLGLLLILGVFLIFYLLLILPVQRQRKKLVQMQAALKPGDRVTTEGGLRGIIVSVKDDAVQLRIPPDSVKLEFLRSAVRHVVTEESQGGK